MKLYVALFILILFLYPLNSQAIDYPESVLRNAPDNCNCVAFRLDDVQDYFTRDAQMDIIDMFLNENLTLTIGAIGGFLYEDIELIQFINNSLKTGLIEVANHGWNHTEHSELTLENQKLSIQKTNERLRELFNVNPTTFIPPENSFNSNTISAMKESNLSYISGSIFTRADDPPFPLKNEDGLFHFPQTAFVSNVDTPSGVWSIFPNLEIKEMIESSMNEYGFAVVVMHPVAHYETQNSTYVYNKDSLQSTLQLLKDLRDQYEFVKISEIEKQSWIPSNKLEITPFYSYYIQESDFELFTSDPQLELKLNDNKLSLIRSEEAWMNPFIIILNGEYIKDHPFLRSEGSDLISMKWFDSSNNTWIVYSNPPISVKSIDLEVLISEPEFDYNLYMTFITLIMVVVTLVIFWGIYRDNGKIRKHQ